MDGSQPGSSGLPDRRYAGMRARSEPLGDRRAAAAIHLRLPCDLPSRSTFAIARLPYARLSLSLCIVPVKASLCVWYIS